MLEEEKGDEEGNNCVGSDDSMSVSVRHLNVVNIVKTKSKYIRTFISCDKLILHSDPCVCV